jgi:hypothetical protein
MAAGLGFKTFTTGEVLTAADTNGYLMQGVLVFASSAARASAVTSPQEGQYSYLKDTDSTEYYDGAAWIAAPIGDITGVTAGTGISGGGTSGTVTITNSMATAIDAKGDLIGGTGADAFDRLAVGTDGQTLVADSTEATGLKWATASGGGKVLQVVNGTYATNTAIASTSLYDTGLSLSITPTSATSKILVLITQPMKLQRAATSDSQGAGYVLLRGATSIYTANQNGYGIAGYFPGSTEFQLSQLVNLAYYDSPATTSSTTYKTQARCLTTVNSGVVIFQDSGQLTSSMTLLEIGA